MAVATGSTSALSMRIALLRARPVRPARMLISVVETFARRSG